jgi:hypothetical protein
MRNAPGSRERSAVPLSRSKYCKLMDGMALEIAHACGSRKLVLQRDATCFAYLWSSGRRGHDSLIVNWEDVYLCNTCTPATEAWAACGADGWAPETLLFLLRHFS